MAEKYFIECGCGRRIRVELFDAGTSKRCPSCQADVAVPNTAKLKELSGDKYPLLRPIEKIERTLQNAEPPFDGLCHACNESNANFEIPVTLDALVERHVYDGNGIRPTITGGIQLTAGATDEQWHSTTFPLLLCETCHGDFQKANSSAGIGKTAGLIGLAALLVAFLYVAYQHPDLIAALAGLISLLGAVAWALRFRHTKKFDPFVVDWLSHIRWVPEAIAAVEEYKLSIGQSRPFRRTSSLK